jgi:acyl-CoA synthetase (AMP-forming)/AMP-acid ligase II
MGERALRATSPVPAERAERYRAEGLWDDRSLADGIEAAAQSHPNEIAVVDNERSYTRAELADLVARGIERLRARGVQPGSGVVLVAGNTAAGVVAYHALLRAGACSALLDRRCGAADLRFALEVLGGGALVVAPAAEGASLLEGVDAALLALESFADAGAGAPAPAKFSEPDRDAAAIVLFTSGTTSRPKGVLHSLNTLAAGARNLAGIQCAERRAAYFLVSPMTSIAGVMQMHVCSEHRGTLVLEDRFEPEASLARINAHAANALGGAPVIAERLLRAAEARFDKKIALRSMALGGAMLPMPLLELASDGFGIEIARCYGSSEAPNSTGSKPSDSRAARLADDGALTPGIEIRVGSREHPQEGMLRGPALFLGYVDPADNAASTEDGWFRTGDAVELDKGRLTVVGRLKDVVNRNGLKISLSEIDGALARLPGVVESACFGLPDAETGERLVVAARPDAGVALSLEGVLAHLRAAGTASRKLPEQLVVWDEPLPRTASGKIVRARLVRESSTKVSDLAVRLRSNP